MPSARSRSGCPGSTMDFRPALMKTSCNSLTRGVSLPSSSPIGKRSPSTWWITPGAVAAAAGYTTQPISRSGRYACQDARGIEAVKLVVVVLAAEPLEVPPGQAVLHGQHDGVGIEQMLDVAHDLIEEMRLHREHHDILLAGFRRPCSPPSFGGLDLAVMPFEFQAVALDRSEMCALIDHGDVFAGSANFAANSPPIAPAPTTQIVSASAARRAETGTAASGRTCSRLPTPSITISTTLLACPSCRHQARCRKR